MAKKQYYAVKSGAISNVIVRSWYECEALVKGFSGAKFKGFTNMAAAESYLKSGSPAKKKSKKSRQEGVDTRQIDPMNYIGTHIPATERTDKYGQFKPLYYMKNGVRHADYGKTVGINYVPSESESLPWAI